MGVKVLIACEFSGTVRDALRAVGVNAVSCDLVPSARPGPHYVCDVMDVLRRDTWGAVIAFPPCTDLAASGAVASGYRKITIPNRKALAEYTHPTAG